MRIKSLRIDRYGPLGEFGPREFGDFALFYGSNEQGKTLLVDAILRLLFKKDLGRRIKDFGNIRRVDEQPEGYIVLDIGGDEVKLERRGSLADHVLVTPADFRNIFIVRDSDLSIHHPEKYYTEVTERLAGLRTSEIERVKKALQQRGRLTNPSSAADLASNVDTGHAGKKIEAARRHLEEIDRIHEDLVKSDFDRLERVLGDHLERAAWVRRELGLLKEARAHERFLTARSRLDELGIIEGELDRLGRFDEGDLDRWKLCERDLKRLRLDLDEVGRDLIRERERFDAFENEVTDGLARVARLDERKRHFDEQLQPKLEEHNRLTKQVSDGRTRKKLWTMCAGVSLSLLALAILGSAASPSIVLAALCVVFLVTSVFFARRLFGLKSIDAKLSGILEDIRLCAARLGIETGSVDALYREKNVLDEEAGDAKRRLDQSKFDHRTSKDRMDTLSARAEKHRNDIAALDGAIDEVKRRSGLDTTEEYHRALVRRTNLLGRKKSLEAGLADLIDAKSENDTGSPDRAGWEKIVGAYFKDAPDAARMIPYDPVRERELRLEAETSRATTTELEDALATGRRRLRDLERDIREPLSSVAEEVVCRTVGDLARARHVLERFVTTIESDKSNAIHALRIFEEVEAEEKARVVELFGLGSNVSLYFQRITGGLYDMVGFDPESVEISANRNDGEVIPADALSGGALDQLYLAIRLSIAERLLSGELGFLIMDDPFVKSDHSRLETQIALLRDIAASGWQILFFSAKREVRDLLDTDIRSGRVDLVSLNAARAAESISGESARERLPLGGGD